MRHVRHVFRLYRVFRAESTDYCGDSAAYLVFHSSWFFILGLLHRAHGTFCACFDFCNCVHSFSADVFCKRRLRLQDCFAILNPLPLTIYYTVLNRAKSIFFEIFLNCQNLVKIYCIIKCAEVNYYV